MQGIVITHVTVVNVRNGDEIPDRAVLIRNSRIVSVNKSAAINNKYKIIDGSGKFLIPGLWDMEVHLSWCKESSIPLLVANGVTAVRDMGGDFGEIKAWQRSIDSGLMTGPHILQGGPMLNGKSFNRYQLATGDSAGVRGIVRALKFMGVDGLEIERRVTKDVFMALIDEAKKQLLPVGGHIQLSVSPLEAKQCRAAYY
jgi:imidazolonepropionase-like amidohydrolase